MAVPKTKQSKARSSRRNSANSKVGVPALVECPTCHEKVKPHTVCAKCGSYNGKQRIEIKKDEK